MTHSRTDRESALPSEFDHSIPQERVVGQIIDKAGDAMAPRTSHCTDRQHVRTHTKVVENIVKYSQSPARQSSEPVSKS